MRSQLRSALIAACIVLMPVSLAIAAYARAQLAPVSYLPMVRTPPQTPTPEPPTAAPTLAPGVTPTVAPGDAICQLSPNPSSAPNSPVMIDDIDKIAEVVSLRNVGAATVDLTGWRMCSINGHQEHTGIGGLLAPGQVRHFAYPGPGAIWNDTQRDDGALYSPAGQLVAYDQNID